MKVLIIDNSNSRTKFAVAAQGMLLTEPMVVPTQELAAGWQLPPAWRFERVCLCSVVPPAAELLLARYPSALQVCVGWQSAVDFSRYRGATTLGADRVADVLAVARGVAQPMLVIDAGTAVTLDVLMPGAPPVFVGGAIAPGLRTMVSALSHGAAQLPELQPQLPACAVGRTTEEAMQSGVVLGFVGAVRELIDRITFEVGESMRIVSTGGDAALLAEQIPEIAEVDPLLTLRGIALYAENVLSQRKKSR